MHRGYRPSTQPNIALKPRVLVIEGWNDPRLIRVVGQYARSAGWCLETRQLFDGVVPRNWQGEGLIALYPRRAELLSFIRRQEPLQPTVLVGANCAGIKATEIIGDDRMAGSLAARHCLEHGHFNFACLTTCRERGFHGRLLGFQEALATAGFKSHRLDYWKEKSKVSDWTRHEWIAERLGAMPKPLACYAFDDKLAAEVIEVSLANGWRVPEDVAVIGTGNSEALCECSHIPISSVDLDEEKIAITAVELLERMMRGSKGPLRQIVIPPRAIVIRSSSDMLVAANPQLHLAVNYIRANPQRPLDLVQLSEVLLPIRFNDARTAVAKRLMHFLI
jgi:LacI family transcriptional regulator